MVKVGYSHGLDAIDQDWGEKLGRSPNFLLNTWLTGFSIPRLLNNHGAMPRISTNENNTNTIIQMQQNDSIHSKFTAAPSNPIHLHLISSHFISSHLDFFKSSSSSLFKTTTDISSVKQEFWHELHCMRGGGDGVSLFKWRDWEEGRKEGRLKKWKWREREERREN